MTIATDIIEKLKTDHAEEVLSTGEHAGQPWISVKRDRIHDILQTLRNEHDFDMLTDLCGMDYLDQGEPERFAVVYNLYSFTTNERFRVKAFVPESDPTIDSAFDIWKAAPWAEREAFDLMGIRFNNHPDLRRILLPEEYEGHPLRKDYPLRGHGERQNFPRYTKDQDGPAN